MQYVDWPRFTHRSISLIGKGSIPLPLGLATYFTLTNSFSGLKGRGWMREIRHARNQDVAEDRPWEQWFRHVASQHSSATSHNPAITANSTVDSASTVLKLLRTQPGKIFAMISIPGLGLLRLPSAKRKSTQHPITVNAFFSFRLRVFHWPTDFSFST